MIKYTSSKQISIEDFNLPFGGELSKENRWAKLTLEMPWDEIISVYLKKMSLKKGRGAVNPRVAIGALIIKHMKSLTDEATVDEIRENPYLQYFLGYEGYSYEAPFTPSLFVSFRRRMGKEEFDALTEGLIGHVRECLEKRGAKPKSGHGQNKGKGGPDGKSENKGHLIVDATVAPADIKYPTDLDLLNDAREKSELLTDLLYKGGHCQKKPRTYKLTARKEYLKLAKQRRKSKKKIRAGLRKQLGYLKRNLKHIECILSSRGDGGFPLEFKYQRMLWVVVEVCRQQKEMYDAKCHSTAHRIVSISQPHVRPIVRGKSGRDVEFGAKTSISLVSGFCFTDRISWDAYNEGGDLKAQVEAYRKRFGHYPAWVSGDTIYGNRENRAYLKEKGIGFSGRKLGRPSLKDKGGDNQRKKKARQRSEVEGKFGEGKRCYNLDCVKAKRAGTSESWIGAVFFVMNIAHWMRVIFLSFFKNTVLQLEKMKVLMKCQLVCFRYRLVGLIRH
jgi:transposase, IS5 family